MVRKTAKFTKKDESDMQRWRWQAKSGSDSQRMIVTGKEWQWQAKSGSNGQRVAVTGKEWQ
jgi:hypothetical protein